MEHRMSSFPNEFQKIAGDAFELHMMASPSPTPGNNAADIAAAASQPRPDLPKSITLRGLNKPKCIKCGNVARSRCPYQSCKSCCAKAQNPCHIHVLKANATFPEKTPSSSSSLIDQPSTEAAPSGNPHRVASLRQLSSTFSQFNNLQAPRLKRPFTKKDAAAINDWRFSKLKEFKDRIVEAENEAFDRYMQNTNLLEEVFSSKTELEGSSEDESLLSNLNSTVRDNDENSILEEKLSLRSNSVRSDNLRKRLQELVHNGLRKLQTTESNEESKDSNRDSALADLMDKLNKAGNEEDLKSCLELKNQLFNKRLKTVEAPILLQSELISTVEIDQESLDRINSHFSSLEDIEDL